VVQAERKRIFQDLLQSRGWEMYCQLVLEDDRENPSKVRQSIKNQIQNKIISSTRSGDWEKAAYYTGQFDIIDILLELPRKELTRA